MATILWRSAPLLIWNASASSPIGLYRIYSPDRIRAGDYVAAWAPGWARELGAARHYLPANVPLIKKVGGVRGDTLCIRGDAIFLNGALAARRRREDGLGRPMPWWEGCQTLRQGQYFLFDANEPDAFDGRYFGVTGEADVIGRASLLWRA